MAQFWTEDPSIGNALAGLATSFDVSRQEDMRKKRAERAAKERYGQTYADLQEAQKSTDLGVSLPPEWGGSISLDVPTYQWTNPSDYAARQTAANNARMDYGLQTSPKNAQEAVAVEAQNQLQTQGLPQTAAGQNIMQTQLTGQLPMLDAKGTTSNYGIQNDTTGEIVGRGTSRDGRTDLITNQPIQAPPGHSVVKMGEVSADQNIYKDEGARSAALDALNRKATIGNQEWTLQDQQRAQILLDKAFPQSQKIEKDAGGQFRIVGYNEKVVPPVYGPLIARINAGLGAAPAPAAPPPPPAPVAPTTTGAGGSAAAAAAAPAPPPAAGAARAAAPPPIVPPGAITTGAGQATISGPIGPEGPAQETQAKTAAFAQLANKAKDDFYKKFGYTPGKGFTDPSAVQKNVPGFLSAVANEYGGTSIAGERLAKTLDPKAQDYNALGYRFVEPVIRLASGAAIGPKEYQQYFRMFIPNANDTPDTAARKLDAMQSWVDAVSGASTSRGALDAMARLAKDPQTAQAVEQIRVKAANAGTLDTPFSQLPGGGGGGASAAPAAAPSAAAPAQTRPAEVAPADREALAWANANPNDPRAAQIKRKLGM